MNLQDYAAEMVANHQKFESFAWFDRPEDDENWTVVYTHNRDSELFARSNAHVIGEVMDPLCGEGDVQAQDDNHFLCGWIAGYAIRVYADGKITEAFSVWFDFVERLEAYPILDEEHYSEMEWADYQETWEGSGRSDFRAELGKLYRAYPCIESVFDDLETDAIDELWESVREKLSWDYQTTDEGTMINIREGVDAVDQGELIKFVKKHRPHRSVTLAPYVKFDPGQMVLFDVS